jgi:hypothetical protein
MNFITRLLTVSIIISINSIVPISSHADFGNENYQATAMKNWKR